MRNSRDDVVRTAHRVLDDYGLGDLTMRRVATELEVQPSALYHHFPGKQALLAAVADHILRRVDLVGAEDDWQVRLRASAGRLRDSLLACRDGAELVATVQAYELGEVRPGEMFESLLLSADLEPQLASVGARTLLFYVLGHVTDEQVNLQAGSAGAITDPVREGSDFGVGVDLVIAGIAVRDRAFTSTGGPVRSLSTSQLQRNRFLGPDREIETEKVSDAGPETSHERPRQDSNLRPGD